MKLNFKIPQYQPDAAVFDGQPSPELRIFIYFCGKFQNRFIGDNNNRMKTRQLILFALLLIALGVCHAQTNMATLSGKVIDENSLPIEYASVAIFDAEKVLTGSVTDNEGGFVIKVPVRTEEYLLSVQFVGYTKHEVRIKADRPNVNLGNIVLIDNTVSLNAIEVVGKADAHTSNIERTNINVAANLNASQGTAIDILTTSSNVSVSNGTIAIRGNSNVLVLLDGVPTTMTDLSVIPASSIQNIEILTNPDASYDSEGTGGIVNIVSKKEKASGINGVVSASYGFNHFATGNASVAFNTPKASYRINYSTRFEDDVLNSTLDRLIHESGNQTHQQIQSTRYVFNTNVGMGADFRIDKSNTLNTTLNCIIPRLNIQQYLHNTYSANGISPEEYRHNDVTWNRENIEATLSYKHIITPEVSDWTIIGAFSKIWGHRPSFYYLGDSLVNRSNSGGSPLITALQVDFRQKLGTGTLTTGGKLTFRRNSIYHEFYSNVDGQWEYSELLSNDLIHTELVPAAYVMFSCKIGLKFSYKLGVRGEYSRVTLDSRHEGIADRKNDFFFAPNLSGTFNISDSQDLSIAFSRRIGRPTYPQLNPYMSMVDATTYEQGNMRLMPEKSSILDLGYGFKVERFQLFADAYANYTKNFITQITTMRNNLLITTYINTPSDFKAGLDLNVKYAPLHWFDVTLSASTYHVDIKGIQEGMQIDNGGWVNNSNVLFNFMPSKKTDIQLQYFVSSPQYFAQLTTAFNHYMNIGIKQRLLKGKMTVTASLTDVFNTREWVVYASNAVFDMENHSTNKSRMLWLGVTYNFNSFKQAKTEKKTDTDRGLIRLGL